MSASSSARRALSCGQEDDADAVGARRAAARRPTQVAEERVGDLHEDAGAVARVGVGALGAAVLEVLERHDRPVHRLVRAAAVQARDEGDATRVVLVCRVVQADPLGGALAWSA